MTLGSYDACTVKKEDSAGAEPPESVLDYVPDGTIHLSLNQIHRGVAP